MAEDRNLPLVVGDSQVLGWWSPSRAAEGWDEVVATKAFTVSRPELALDMMRGLAEGMAAYSARQAEQGLDDLIDSDAAADMAAFLERGPA
ncbi:MULTISPECIES: hypothetical protein [Streptomyces albovinaceus subgroup]|uniref:hypothetical protein n=1 Tax=Streptomyces albovinaceus subgroup TaxID=1482558 RepID=UPI0004C6AC9A|nr:hypothetical protein [Streptomyces mediolani]